MQQKRSRWIRPLIWGTALAAVVGSIGGYWLFNGDDNVEASGTVTWVTVRRGDVEKTVSLSGTLTPSSQVTLTASGKVTDVYVKAGQKVTKGQKIAQLDTSSLRTQLKIAEAQLIQAKAKLDQVREPETVTDNRGHTVTKDPDPNTIKEAKAGVTQAEAQVDSIQQQIADSTLASPINGTVLQVMDPNTASGVSGGSSGTKGGSGSSGTDSSAGTNSGANTVAVIADLSASKFHVQANVPQSDAAEIKPGQPAVISLSAGGDTKLTGKVEEIVYLAQTDGGVTTYPVIVQVDPPRSDVTLLPGTNVSVDVTVSKAKNVLRVPVAAITQHRNVTGVYVKDVSGGPAAQANETVRGEGRPRTFSVPSGLKFVPVTVGLYGGDAVEIKSGLREGEQVAIYIPPAAEQVTGPHSNGMGGFFGGFGDRGGPRSGMRGLRSGAANGGNR